MSSKMKLARAPPQASASPFSLLRLRRRQQARIMTGPQGGSWYPLGGAFANIMGEYGVQPSGSAGWPALPMSAPFPKARPISASATRSPRSMALPVARRSKIPRRTSATSRPCIRSISRSLALADAGIDSIADFEGQFICPWRSSRDGKHGRVRGRRRRSEVAGLTYDDLDRVSHVSYTDAVSLMRDNNAEVFTLGTTVPASAMMDLASSRDIKLVNMPDDTFEAMRELNPGYTKLTIPAGSYPGQDEDVQAVGYATHIIARLRSRRGRGLQSGRGHARETWRTSPPSCA